MTVANFSGQQGFGDRLRELRKKLGLSVAKFAGAVGFDRTYVHRIENGQAINPSLNFIEAVSGRFGVDREWLVGGVGGAHALQMQIKPARVGHDAHIWMRLECLETIIDTYTVEELQAALEYFNKLADSDKTCGKISGEVATVIGCQLLRKLSRQSSQKIKAGPKQKTKLKRYLA